MPFLSDLDHYRLETIFLEDSSGDVVHCESFSDVRRGLRNVRKETRWCRQKKIGHGSFSDVFLETQKEDTESTRAVKVIKRDLLLALDYTRELKALAEFSKPRYRQSGNFVEFYGWWEKEDVVYLAMEYVPLGDLSAHMTNSFEEAEVREITIQILQGLETMHEQRFAHRDLKPSNIFVVQQAPSWWVKIGDFGITKRVEGETELRTFTGTQDFQAPEFFGYVDCVDEESPRYTHAVDLWALGCIIFKLCTHTVPFPSTPNLRPLQKYSCGKAAFPDEKYPGNFSHGMFKLIMKLLDPSPDTRLTAAEALRLIEGQRTTVMVTNSHQRTLSRATSSISSSDAITGKADRDEACASQHDNCDPYKRANQEIDAIEDQSPKPSLELDTRSLQGRDNHSLSSSSTSSSIRSDSKKGSTTRPKTETGVRPTLQPVEITTLSRAPPSEVYGREPAGSSESGEGSTLKPRRKSKERVFREVEAPHSNRERNHGQTGVVAGLPSSRSSGKYNGAIDETASDRNLTARSESSDRSQPRNHLIRETRRLPDRITPPQYSLSPNSTQRQLPLISAESGSSQASLERSNETIVNSNSRQRSRGQHRSVDVSIIDSNNEDESCEQLQYSEFRRATISNDLLQPSSPPGDSKPRPALSRRAKPKVSFEEKLNGRNDKGDTRDSETSAESATPVSRERIRQAPLKFIKKILAPEPKYTSAYEGLGGARSYSMQ